MAAGVSLKVYASVYIYTSCFSFVIEATNTVSYKLNAVHVALFQTSLTLVQIVSYICL